MRTMAEAATRTTTIASTPERVWEIVTDFERYPEWARDLKVVTVVARDGEGRPIEVEFRAGALGRSAHYTLHYDYTGAPSTLSWKLVRGDIMRAIDGAYQFTPSTTLPGGTDVVYDLEIELVVPMPGFVKRRAEVRILNTLKELKARAEG
jgi:carbon monoxide dehydrogenase subunit G